MSDLDDPTLNRLRREVVIARHEANARREEEAAAANLEAIARRHHLVKAEDLTPKNGVHHDAPWLTPLSTLLSQPDEPVEWQIDGLIVTGGIAVVGAKPKVGKTTILHQLALTVARGSTFLGRRCEKGPVVYLALEEHRGRVVARFRDLGATDEDEIHLLIGPAPEQALTMLRQTIAELHAKVAIIDPIQRLTRLENINDYSEVSNATEPLIALARDTSCSVVFSHHLGKGEREGADQILGSTALFGSVDTAILMRRRQDKTRTIESFQRYGEDLESSVLGHSDENGSSWIVGTAESVDAAAAQQAVLDLLGASEAPMARDGIEEAIPIRSEDIRSALSELVKKGTIVRSGEGKRGHPFTYSPRYR
jgi:AAA domain